VLTLPPNVRIYLATGKVDLRRGHDGLGAIVRNQWKADIYGGHLFVFVGRRADRCKIWSTRREAAEAIHEYIEVFYNRRRRHTTLGGKAPAVFEALAERQVAQAA
jgi:transposase